MNTIFSDFPTWEAFFLGCIPLLIFALLAVVLPALLRRFLAFLLPRLRPHLPDWLNILLTGFERPCYLIVRCFFIGMMLYSLPFAFNGATFKRSVIIGLQIAALSLIGWGAWRSAPVCRLLLRSAENRLDFSTGKTMTAFFENIYRFLVVLFLGIAVLDCLGIPVTGLLTGAGVAGLAVSLAAQSTLSNLIAGVTLVMERPFGIGDYVVLGGYEGTVEDVSFRSTRLRTKDNSLITVENSKVCAEYIQNVTNRTSRLWEFTLGVTYDTPRDKLEALCAAVTAVLNRDSGVVPGSVSVTLSDFGASSINLLARAYVTSLDLRDFLELKSRLNLQLMDTMREQGCEFAFPSATVYLSQNPD